MKNSELSKREDMLWKKKRKHISSSNGIINYSGGSEPTLKRYFLMNATKVEAIKYLRERTKIFISKPVSLFQRRQSFETDKWKWFKLWKNQKCMACKANWINHIHHTVMLKNGGSNSINNLVGLCRECHFEIHDWMKPMELKAV